MTPNQMVGSPGQSYYVNGNTYTADGGGLITGYKNSSGSFTGIAQGDVVGLINSGAQPATLRTKSLALGAVAAASAVGIVASGALSNGSLTIAAQPDVARQLQFVVNPGNQPITAGTLTLVYGNSDGVASTDALSLVTPASTALTLTSSRGVSHLTSAVVSGLTGGNSPNIQGGTNGVLALPADSGQAGLTMYKAQMDGADVALPTQSATDGHLITPGTAPNGTHTYNISYGYYSF